MTGSTELELGAQTRAAAVVEGAINPVQQALHDLERVWESERPGFRGAAAAGFAEAVDAWLDAARDLVPALGGMAHGLLRTDATAAAAGHAQQARYAALLGGTGSAGR